MDAAEFKAELLRQIADPDVRAALREAVAAPGDTVRVARATMIEAGVPFGLESSAPVPGRSRPVPPWLEGHAARHGKPER